MSTEVFSPEQIAEFERQVEEAKENLKLKEAVLDMAREANQGSSVSDHQPLATAKPIPDGKIDLSEIELPPSKKANKRTQKDDVKDAINRLEDQKWTISHLLIVLEKIGRPIKGSTARNRVYAMVKELVNEGSVVLVSKGKGSDPNYYQRKAKFSVVAGNEQS